MRLEGSIDARGMPRVPITLRGPWGSENVEAVVDTGFTGSLSAPPGLIRRLGLRHHDNRPTVLANGSLFVAAVYLARLEWLDGEIIPEVMESYNSEVLIGARLLRGHVLHVDYGPAQSAEIR
jgi:clan AA aspartic protease